MNAHVELNLAMILFLPWFLILGALFWVYPRGPRGAFRNVFDIASLGLATLAGVWGTWWSMENADPGYGNLWRQILASTISYGLFLAVMCVAIALRHVLLRRRAAPPSSALPEATP
jgi:hypothetical protein